VTTEKFKDVDERFQHYRGLATALSATIIGISGGLFYWLMGLDDPLLMTDRIARILLGASVVFAVLLQFFHVMGSVHHARAGHKNYLWSLGPSALPSIDPDELHTEMGDELTFSQDAFTRMDWCIKLAVWIHLLGLIFVGIGHL